MTEEQGTGTLRKAYARFLKIRGNPREIALGLSLGVFMGMLPVLGFQMAGAVLLAALLGWNKLAATLGTLITNPVSAPFIFAFTYQIGGRILALGKQPPQKMTYDFSMILRMWDKAPDILRAMTVGGLVLGIPLAILTYFLALSAIRTYRADLKERLAAQRHKLTTGGRRLLDQSRGVRTKLVRRRTHWRARNRRKKKNR